MGKGKAVSDEGRMIAANLRSLRERAGLSQSEVAASLDISHQQIQKYEAGVNRIPLQIMPVFCDLFGVPVEAFLSGLSGEAGRDMQEWRELKLSFGRVGSAPLRRKILQVVDILAS